RNNTYHDCGKAAGNMGSHAIAVDATGFRLYGREDDFGPAGFHRNIVIEGNTIAGDGVAISLCSAEDVVVRDNRIEGTNPAIALHNCRNVRVEGNELPAGAGAAEAVRIGSGCDRRTVTIT
ncbi:MAG: right-handed parallel beta-helix repeat-containing protein, partial [Spirochaetaceae bacterium]|nr:right-handed parallel beta-helix repeat-containing protein [Spirochaetaceae bacterium]